MHVLTASEISKLPGVKRVEVIGGQTLIEADCLEVMPLLGRFDAVVTDPPYGLSKPYTDGVNPSKGQGRSWKGLGKNKDESNCARWDAVIDKKFFQIMFDVSKHQIIWGANYLMDHLPRTKQMFIWNKMIRGMHFNDCEIAWTSQWREASRVFDYSPSSAEPKQHPTQKPVAVMNWCLSRLPHDTTTILDPFMGSGTTLVACQRLGRQGTGIELDSDYFDIACRRVDEATRQPDMFVQAPTPAQTQEPLL